MGVVGGRDGRVRNAAGGAKQEAERREEIERKEERSKSTRKRGRRMDIVTVVR